MNDCQKTYNKVVTSTNHNRRKQRDEPAIIRNFFKAREKSHVQAALGFGFASHWLNKTGAPISLSQSLNVEIAITQLISASIWKLL